jgi:hypothetical protein
MKSDQWKMAAYWFLPGAAIGALLMWMYTGSIGITMPAPNPDSTANASEQQPTNEQAPQHQLEVRDQPAGHAVIVERVVLTETSWVAVRELNEDGSVGNILGAARRDAGEHERVVVDLLRSTEPDKRYALVIFTDDGDKAFDSKKDTPVMEAENKLLMSAFGAQTPLGPGGQ